MTESGRNAWLALAASAGLHLIAMMTLDLSPGAWRHGFAPALKVTLRAPPAGEFEAVQPATPLKQAPAPSEVPVKPEPKDSGIASQTPRAGSSIPTPVRYYKNSEVDVPAVPLSRGPLIFPEHAFLSKLKGTVQARIYIDEDGNVESVQIVAVKPFAGHFEDAALEALRQVRYKPAEIAGQPVKTQKLIEVTFDPYEKS